LQFVTAIINRIVQAADLNYKGDGSDSDVDKYRAGILYFQVGPVKIGYNSENIRDNTQNKLHKLLGTDKNPLFTVMPRPDKWFFEFGW
jgi:hypothetical protein